MNNYPLVSIIIPTFHCEPYIKRALDSALNQTYKNIEVFVVNNSEEKAVLVDGILKEFKNDNLNILKIPNLGAPNAKNTAIDRSNGKYVYVLGGDDILIDTAIEKHVTTIESESGATITYSDYRHFYGFNEKELFETPFIRNNYSGYILQQLIDEGNFIAGGSALMPREAIIKAGMFKGYSLVDWDLWLRMSINGCKFKYINDILLLVRKVPGSLSSDKHKLLISRINILENIQRYDIDKNIKKKISIKVGNARFALCMYLIKNKYYKGIFHEFINGIKSYCNGGIKETIKSTGALLKYRYKRNQ